MRLVLTTVPVSEANALKTKMVEQRLAGCALEIKLSSPSVFWWEGKLDQAEESLLIFKTTEKRVNDLFKAIKNNHPYDVPFIAEIKVEKAYSGFIKWLEEVVE